MIVVIGFIEQKERVLITRRALDTHYGGFWELPGGKVEEGETPSLALIREFKEELGIEISKAHLLCKISQNLIDFYLYHVVSYQHEPKLLAGQMDMRWALIQDLQKLSFPPLNQLFFEIWGNYKREIPS